MVKCFLGKPGPKSHTRQNEAWHRDDTSVHYYKVFISIRYFISMRFKTRQNEVRAGDENLLEMSVV